MCRKVLPSVWPIAELVAASYYYCHSSLWIWPRSSGACLQTTARLANGRCAWGRSTEACVCWGRGRPGCKSWRHHMSAVWPRASHLTPLSSSVLMREDEVMTTSISHNRYEHFWCTHTAHGKFKAHLLRLTWYINHMTNFSPRCRAHSLAPDIRGAVLSFAPACLPEATHSGRSLQLLSWSCWDLLRSNYTASSPMQSEPCTCLLARHWDVNVRPWSCLGPPLPFPGGTGEGIWEPPAATSERDLWGLLISAGEGQWGAFEVSVLNIPHDLPAISMLSAKEVNGRKQT